MVTAKLICVFVFAYAKCRFSHDEAQLKIGLDSFSKHTLNVWPLFGFTTVLESNVLLKCAKLQYLLWFFCQVYRVTDEESEVWRIFFLINIIPVLKGSEFYFLGDSCSSFSCLSNFAFYLQIVRLDIFL